jgi:hypothetical protein
VFGFVTVLSSQGQIADDYLLQLRDEPEATQPQRNDATAARKRVRRARKPAQFRSFHAWNVNSAMRSGTEEESVRK